MNQNAEATLAFSFLIAIIISLSMVILTWNSSYGKVIDRESQFPSNYLYDIDFASYSDNSLDYITFYEKMFPFIYRKIGPYEAHNIELISRDLQSHLAIIDYQGKTITFTDRKSFDLK